MKTIWKQPLSSTGEVFFPKGAKFLCVQTQLDEPHVWALVDSDFPNCSYLLGVYGTGHVIKEDPGKYLGTFQLKNGLVFHVFTGVQ